MVLTVISILILGAFILTLVSAAGKCPLWVPVLLVVIVEALRILPLGK